jgi:hypothetical protein
MIGISKVEFGGVNFNEFQTAGTDRDRSATLAHTARTI